jgi:hypothetical protein
VGQNTWLSERCNGKMGCVVPFTAYMTVRCSRV